MNRAAAESSLPLLVLFACFSLSGVARAAKPESPTFGALSLVGPAVEPALEDRDPNSLTVEQAVEEALEHNLEILAARYDIPIAHAEKVTAKLRLNPVLSFGADHLDVLGTGYDNVNKAGPQEFFVRADMFIMAGRKRKHRLEHADDVGATAELEFEDELRELRLRVQLACVAVQLAEANLALARDNQTLFDDIVALNEKRVESGETAGVELRRSRIAATEAANDVRRQDASLQMARNVLGELLGRDTPVTITIAEDFRRTGKPGARDELQLRSLEHRPDYQATQNEQVRAEHDIKRQVAEGKIDVAVGVEVRRQQGLAGTGNSLGLFVSVPLPIFDRNQGGVERARQVAKAADADRDAMARTIETEVDNGYVAYQTARDLLETYEGGLLDDASSVLRTADYAYRRGEVSLIELLDAQHAFNTTRAEYNEARAAYAEALYTIEAVSATPLPP